jgi:hypothetical protein
MSPKLSEVGTLDTNELMIGLSSWVIADGNYPHFERRKRASFALTFYAPDPLSIPSDYLSVNPPGVDRTSMQHVAGSYYMVTAKVTHVLDHDGWWVIDTGVLMYRAGMPPGDIKAGCWVSGRINVGVDPFDYFERLSRYYAAPALIYDWDVKKIELETTPIIESGRMRMRDQSRREWREVKDTKARAGGPVDEFVLHCARLDTPPRR